MLENKKFRNPSNEHPIRAPDAAFIQDMKPCKVSMYLVENIWIFNSMSLSLKKPIKMLEWSCFWNNPNLCQHYRRNIPRWTLSLYMKLGVLRIPKSYLINLVILRISAITDLWRNLWLLEEICDYSTLIKVNLKFYCSLNSEYLFYCDHIYLLSIWPSYLTIY